MSAFKQDSGSARLRKEPRMPVSVGANIGRRCVVAQGPKRPHQFVDVRGKEYRVRGGGTCPRRARASRRLEGAGVGYTRQSARKNRADDSFLARVIRDTRADHPGGCPWQGVGRIGRVVNDDFWAVREHQILGAARSHVVHYAHACTQGGATHEYRCTRIRLRASDDAQHAA